MIDYSEVVKLMNKLDQEHLIKQISQEITACRLCHDNPRYPPAMAMPPRPVCTISASAPIAICGQAPGMRVYNTGIAFNDPSGDRLRQWLNVSRESFYNPDHFAIIPMGFCFPGYDKNGGDLPPRRECKEIWHDQIFPLMPQIKLVIVIGQYAQSYHLGKRRQKTLTETVLHWRDFFEAPDENDRRILPLPHPSWRNTGWLKRNPWFEHDLLPELQKLTASLLLNPD